MITRDEFAWLIVRAVGAFVLLLIALDLITIALTSVQAMTLRNDMMSAARDDIIPMASNYGRLISRIWYMGVGVLLKSLFAYYCFYRGAWIHKLLTRKLPSAEQS